MNSGKFKKIALASAGAVSALMPTLARAADYSSDYSTTTTTTDGAAAAGIIGVSLIFMLLWFAFVIFSLVYWIIMLVDVIKRTNWENESDKTLWLLVVILLGILGALVYRFVIVSKLGKASAPKTATPAAKPVEAAKPTEDKK